MNFLKSFAKIIGSLLLGVAIGLILAGAGVILFTDTTLPEFIDKLKSASVSEGILAALVGGLAFVIFEILLIFVHEGGHLVCGLLGGYRFVSFRLMNLTFIRLDGRLRVKRYSVAGTGGQCLLVPPDLPLDRIPTGWYNAGGVIANLVCFAAVLPLLFLPGLSPLATELIVMFLIADAILILLNGIPMKIAGAGNDAYNMLLLRRNRDSKRGFVNQLRANAQIQNGVRPKDMPDEWFVMPEDVDYGNPLEVSLPMMYASRRLDMKDYAGAKAVFGQLYDHKDRIIGLYVKEIACELAYLYILSGDTSRAEGLLDKELMTYINTYRKVMSSKTRLLCAISLFIDRDAAAARDIYENLEARKDEYLLQGEVASDLALMEDMLAIGSDIRDA